MGVFTFKLSRYEDDGSVTEQALVTVRSTTGYPKGSDIEEAASNIITNKDAMNAICRAVSKWVMNTEEGKKEWEGSSRNFNIGDLSAYNGDEMLAVFLLGEGLSGLNIEIDAVFPEIEGFVFDTVLPEKSDDFEDPLK